MIGRKACWLAVVCMGSWLVASAGVLAADKASSAGGGESVAVGSTVSGLQFKDVWYLPRSLKDLGEHRAYAILLAATDCPLCEQALPEWGRLAEHYADQGVEFLVLNVSPRDSIRDMAAQQLACELKVPFVKDLDGQAAAALGATQLGQAVVLDDKGRIRYRGRISARLAQTQGAAATTADSDADSTAIGGELAAALDDILADRQVAVPETDVAGCAIERPAAVERGGEPVNYAEHIAPLLAEHCAGCHRPDTEAPFALLTYDDARGYAEMIAEVVSEERMPPWYASFGRFENEPGLSAEDRDRVRQWVAAGCPPGDLSQIPQQQPVVRTADGWEIDEPDLVLTVPQVHELPADGYVPYKYVVLPHRFAHDTWIQQCEIKPDNPRVVHHCNMAYILNPLDRSTVNFVLGKVPGVQPMRFDHNVGYRIPKGAMLILQIHYTTTGQPETCQISVGLRFAREVIHKEFHFLWMVNDQFAIPPGDPLHRVTATNTLPVDALGVGLFAHMHVRGRHMSFVAHYPDGTSERLLTIPNYSFDWQLAYQFEIGQRRFPAGTRIECVSHYDNSTFNPYNPDPTATVTEGQQTFEEMLNGVMFYLADHEELNLHIDPATGAVIEPEGKGG